VALVSQPSDAPALAKACAESGHLLLIWFVCALICIQNNHHIMECTGK